MIPRGLSKVQKAMIDFFFLWQGDFQVEEKEYSSYCYLCMSLYFSIIATLKGFFTMSDLILLSLVGILWQISKKDILNTAKTVSMPWVLFYNWSFEVNLTTVFKWSFYQSVLACLETQNGPTCRFWQTVFYSLYILHRVKKNFMNT